jgi:CheY-like chemotaxis protein
MTYLKKILLVDHEALANDRVRHALEETGKYLIKEEHEYRNLLNAARWFQPDLILLDVMLAGAKTSAVARQLQDDPEFKDTPVVFLSGNASADGQVLSGGFLNGYSFLANPVALDDLVNCVAELLTTEPDCA